MGWRDWPGYGGDYLVTPGIDKLGKEGLVFDQGYVNAANSRPLGVPSSPVNIRPATTSFSVVHVLFWEAVTRD